MSSRSQPSPLTPSSHIPTQTCPPLQPPPTEFSTNTDAIRRISLQHPPIHPSIQSIHPYLPPKRMEPRMLPLPQLLPLLKGTPAPFFGQPFSAETTDDIKKIYIRGEKTELSSRAVALDSVFIYCRSALLQPSLYFAWQHWVARACAVGADRSVTWPAADCTATDREWREHGSDCLQASVSLCFCVWWAHHALSMFAYVKCILQNAPRKLMMPVIQQQPLPPQQ